MVLDTTATTGRGPQVVPLGGNGDDDPDTVGAKAAALAVGRRAELPVLDGFVLPTTAIEAWKRARPGALPSVLADDLHQAWQRLRHDGAVIVRSSSPNEDGPASSLAGHFASVLDVRTWDGLLTAIDEVAASAGSDPMAVLVQPFVEPRWGGVLFGADPITGRRDRRVVSAVPGGPHHLVSGSQSGSQLLLSRRGRILESSGNPGDGPSARRLRRALVRLADQAGDLFGGPQDIEWAVLEDSTLVLLQSRPITAIGDEAAPATEGTVLGPAPVAETFPGPLSTLEADLWLPPLREGLRRSLGVMGTASTRQLRSSPVLVAIEGRPAVDLDLLGLSPLRKSWWARLDPRPPARQALAAWRVGRLRAALPALADDLISDVDAELRSVPDLIELPAAAQLRLLEQAQGVLRSLHGYEVLAGQLLQPDLEDTATNSRRPTTAATRALAVLETARADDPEVADDQLIAEHPVLLSLSAPAIGLVPKLPPAPGRRSSDAAPSRRGPGEAAVAPDVPWRESLRLRIRWLHELTARTALALGHELVRRGVLERPELVRELTFDDLRAAVAGHQVDVPEPHTPTSTPLPRAFRLVADDLVVPVASPNGRNAGRGAGGGRGMGQIYSGSGTPPPDAVLVVRTLDPTLAPLLPGLSGLISETGSVLSHLAILAREHGVPTVVDLPDATQRHPPGSWVVVDGTTGEVSAVDSKEWGGT